MFKVSFQPIPLLHSEPLGDVWAWSVLDGSVIVARFISRELAEDYADWRTARSRGLPPEIAENKRLAIALAQALVERQAAEEALQAFVDGKFVVKET